VKLRKTGKDIKMGIRRGSSHRIVFGLIITFVIVIVLCSFLFIQQRNKNWRRLERLLCETDYQVLLEACRELSKRVTTGNLKPGTYWVRYDRDLKASQFQFPQVILDIEPGFVKISSNGWVMLEMGGIPTYGVSAYPEAFRTDYPHGNIELIPSLWYYDEDYSDKYPEWQKRIDELIQKGKMRQKEKIADSANNEK
jgi:hypothetical protein